MEPERTSRELGAARLSRRPPRFAATAMALGIIFAVAYVFFIRTPPPVPTPHISGVKGTYIWNQGDNGEHGTFSAVAAGNAGGRIQERLPANRFGGPQGELDSSAYDAKSRSELTKRLWPAVDGYDRTIDAWPAVWRVATRSPLDYQGLAAIVRTAVEDRDRSVGIKPLKDGDREVWRAAMTLDGQDIELVVDQQSGLVTWYTDGRSTFTATVDWSSPPPADTTYVLKVAAGQRVTTKRDKHYQYASSLAEAGRAAGYTPLESTLAPDGYAVRAVASAFWLADPGWWIVHHATVFLPRTFLAGQRQVVSLYTRGLSWFTVQQLGPKAAKEAQGIIRNAVQNDRSAKLSFQAAELQYGAMTGALAYTWYEKSGPTLFASDAQHIVYITGALTRQELIAFAEGLKPWGSSGSASPSSSP